MTKELNKRYPGKDYTDTGYYFITIKTLKRRRLFGKVIGSTKSGRQSQPSAGQTQPSAGQSQPSAGQSQPSAGQRGYSGRQTQPSAGQTGEPRMEYTDFGKKVLRQVWDMPHIGVCAGKFRIDQFQIMPDHIHILFRVMERLPIHLGMLLAGFNKGCRTAFREVYGIPLETDKRQAALENRQAKLLQDKAFCHAKNGFAIESPHSFDPWGICSAENGFAITLFAEGYNDWVVIKRGQLNAYFQYIKDNCRRYKLREDYPNLFRKVWGKELLPGMRFNLLGNMFLLQRPVRQQVRISRFVVDPSCLVNGLEPRHAVYSYPKREKTEAEIQEAIKPYLRLARKGAVLVTPAISPAEKAIVQAAYSEGLFVIRLLLQGMSEVHKPDGANIDACAKGLLLELDPWGYDPTRKYTKETCEALNDLAKRFCE